MNSPSPPPLQKHYNFAADSFDPHAFGGADGNRTALVSDVGAGIVSRHTFLDLAEDSCRLAHILSIAGVKPGDVAILLMAPSGAAAVALLAAMRVGAVAAPMPLDVSIDFLSGKISRLKVGAVIGDQHSIDLVSAIAHVFPDIRHFSAANASAERVPELWTSLIGIPEHFESRRSSSRDPALLLHHEDMPAGALYSFGALRARIAAAERTYRGFPIVGDVVWSVSDWASENGWIDAVLPSWNCGVPVVATPSDPADLDGILTRWGVRAVHLPTGNLPLFRQAMGTKKTPLRVLAAVGEMSYADHVFLKERFGRAFAPVFASPVFGPMLVPDAGAGMEGAYGKPPPRYSVDVVDAKGRILPAGEIGEISVLANEPFLPLGANKCRGCTRIGRWLGLGKPGKRDLDGVFWPDPALTPPPPSPPRKKPPGRRLAPPNPKDRWS
ncbi:hypothetical protein FACS1894205_6190 [Alphaproteobacteria bacterium]|nr:hypothetical protein FACS1894205_6190 [Alphaproteobacteria bacterium]